MRRAEHTQRNHAGGSHGAESRQQTPVVVAVHRRKTRDVRHTGIVNPRPDGNRRNGLHRQERERLSECLDAEAPAEKRVKQKLDHGVVYADPGHTQHDTLQHGGTLRT